MNKTIGVILLSILHRNTAPYQQINFQHDQNVVQFQSNYWAYQLKSVLSHGHMQTRQANTTSIVLYNVPAIPKHMSQLFFPIQWHAFIQWLNNSNNVHYTEHSICLSDGFAVGPIVAMFSSVKRSTRQAVRKNNLNSEGRESSRLLRSWHAEHMHASDLARPAYSRTRNLFKINRQNL
jgi:hypothetical protein